MKVPNEIRKIDSGATIEKKFGRWMARVHGYDFELGSTISDLERTLSETEILFQMKAIPINLELGLRWDSRTGFWCARGYDSNDEIFSIEKARTVAGKIRFRHLHTDYDSILACGATKEEAREQIEHLINGGNEICNSN